MDIKLLPKSVRDNLRTGTTIKSIGHCIVQLVLNSLDARSTSIAIRVNLITSNIQIIDNGIGISKKNLILLGFRYATNKYFSAKENKDNQHMFGFKGEALASIIKLSRIVTISTRHTAISKTYSKVFINGKLSKIHTVTQRPSIGTTIILEDVMYNMPVRKNYVKHCLDEVRHEIESIALIHPHTSFTVKNDATSEIIFQTYKLKYVYQTAALLYGKEFSKLLRKLNYTEDNFTITGFIRIEPYTTNKVQFVYINKRLVKKTKIHSLVNHLLNTSLIFKTNDSPKLKYTAYIINLKCPNSEIDIVTDLIIEFKHWDKLLTFIEVAIIQFLAKHKLKISPKPVKGLHLLKGSPVIPDNRIFRTSQVRGVIRGLPMKRKLELTNSLNCVEPAPKLNITSGESQISLVSTENNGKDLIMDMFLKSTAIYKPIEPKEPEVFSFDTALNYTKRSVCILSSEDNICTHFSFPPTNQHCDKEEIINPTLQITNLNHSEFKKPLIPNLQKSNHIFEFKLSNNKTVVQKQETKKHKHRNIIINAKNRHKYQSKIMNNNLKRCSSESTFSHRTLTSFNYNNYKYIIRKHITRNTKYDFIQPAQRILKECRTKRENVFRKKDIHVNTMIRSWFDFRQKNTILNRSNRMPFGHFDHQFYEMPIKQIQRKKMPNRVNYRNYNITFDSPVTENLKFVNPNNTAKNCFVQNLSHQTYINSKNNDAFNITCLSYNSDNNHLRNNSFDVNDLNSILSPLDNVKYNKIITPPQSSTDQRYLFNSYTSNTNGKVINYPDTPQNEFIPYQTNPNLFHFIDTHKPNSATYDILSSNNTNSRIMPPKHTSLKISDTKCINARIPPNRKISPMLMINSKNVLVEDPDSILGTYNSHTKLHVISNQSTTTTVKSLDFSNSVNDVNQVIINASYTDTDQSEKPDHMLKKLEYNHENLNNNIISPIIIETASHNTEAISDNCFSNSLDTRFVKDLHNVKNLIQTLYNTNSTSFSNKNNEPKHIVMALKDNVNKTKDINDLNTINNTPKDVNNSEIHTKWSKQTTLSGNQFYLNERTGMTSFVAPKSSEEYSMSKRYSFMPKGMSQLLVPTLTTKSLTPNAKNNLYETITNTEDCLRKVKWMNYFETKDSDSFFNELFSNKKHFETAIPNISLKSVSRKVSNALDNFRFAKESIDQITVINQWDSKFIITQICIDANTDILACFDQHAVHERILLEQLLQDYYEIHNEKLKSINCIVPVIIKIEESEVRMLQNYKCHFDNWGFSYEVNTGNVTFIRIPKCWQVKDDSNSSIKNCLKTLLESLIQEESNWLRSVGHMHTALPLVILNGIKMEACRGAIKFGDKLTKDQCTDYIKRLSSCDLPFQCAHGRPTVVPLLNLKQFQ